MIEKEYKQAKGFSEVFFDHRELHNTISNKNLVFLELDKLEIHFGQLNLLKLFLFKNQKDLCQNNRCQEEQKALYT